MLFGGVGGRVAAAVKMQVIPRRVQEGTKTGVRTRVSSRGGEDKAMLAKVRERKGLSGDMLS